MVAVLPPDEPLPSEALARLADAACAMARVSVEAGAAEPATRAALRIVTEITESDAVAHYALTEHCGAVVLRDGGPAELDLSRSRAAREATSACARRGTPELRAAPELGAGAHVAAVPIRAGGRASGVLALVRIQGRPFGADDLHLAERAAELFGACVASACAHAGARRRLEDTRVLLEVGRSVTMSIELDARLEASASAINGMVGAGRAAIFLLDPDGGALCARATSDRASRSALSGVVIPMSSDTVLVRVVKSGKPTFVADTADRKDVWMPACDVCGAHAARSLLGLPLLVDGRPIGAVVLVDLAQPRVWTADEIERAELVAQQIAVAVENARLYDELRASYAALEKTQRELLVRERLAALGQLAATIAHEVRNPLAVLFNSLGTLEKRIPQGGDASTLLRIMDEEVRRLDNLVRELLEFARPRLLDPEPVSLEAIVTGAIDAALRQLADAELVVDAHVDEGLPEVPLDAPTVRSAVVNLVVNAAQASGPRGRIVVRASVGEHDGRKVARIEVQDDGPGMEASLAARVFEPFFTTKATGTGLGLAIVKSIVEAHRGDIQVRSTPGRGTTMAMHFPLPS